jgi:hypothetical protein
VANGGTVGTTAVTAMPASVSQLEIGVERGASWNNGLIHRIFYIPSREADATIQALTA